MADKKEKPRIERKDAKIEEPEQAVEAVEPDSFLFVGEKSEPPSAVENDTVAPSENPFAVDGKSPADIMRIFYNYDIPILPVVSKRGLLFGILKKDDVISELSDIGRSEQYSIDEFITKLAKKMSFEELLVYGTIREFPVMNIFGELSSNWTRVQLFAAAESTTVVEAEDEVHSQKEEQVMDWFIYFILEHIPRPLYALNDKGKTMFYNGPFERLYASKMAGDVDVAFVEAAIKDSDRNEVLPGYKGELSFYNKDLGCNYEKIPLSSKKQKVGYLLYFDDNQFDENVIALSRDEIKTMSLNNILAAVEREVIVDGLSGGNDLKEVAEALKISRQSLTNRMKKLGINR